VGSKRRGPTKDLSEERRGNGGQDNRKVGKSFRNILQGESTDTEQMGGKGGNGTIGKGEAKRTKTRQQEQAERYGREEGP
jgi:hypothetical protein